jgi:hypothetical protein
MGDVFVGDRVTLDDEEDAIIPCGNYTVSKVNEDGSFHVETPEGRVGNTAVWPRRILAVLSKDRN